MRDPSLFEKLKRVSFYLRVRQIDALRAESKATGVPIAALIRMAVHEYHDARRGQACKGGR